MNRIAEINDRFRKEILTKPEKRNDGRLFVTQGVASLDADTQMIILAKVRAFDTFNADNDPYEEHDFGSVEVTTFGRLYKFFWKIDYYQDANMDCGTEDRVKAYRVLMIMLASEY